MNLVPLPVPWLELAIAVALAGAVVVSRMHDPVRVWRWGLAFTGAVLGCALLACLGFYLCRNSAVENHWSFESELFGGEFLQLDELNAPLLPMVALIHFLTALATGRTKMRRFSLSWSLTSAGIRLGIFGCAASWLLIALLTVCVVPAYVELRNRGKPTRVYVLHMSLFVVLLTLGWALVDPLARHGEQSVWAAVLLLAAVLIRCGAVPVHCWLTDWFEQASFGNALLFVTPLVGVYAAVRLVLPAAPDWVLQGIGFVSLLTAVYAAGLAVVQQNARRFFAYLFLSHASLVLVGLELHTPLVLTGALALWVSASLSLAGFGLTLRALEARFGQVSLGRFHGLYDHSPMLAVCFLLTGLASVGFPGTLGFVAAEMLVDGAVEANLFVGLGVALAAALNGIAVVRAYFYLFTGARHVSTVPLGIEPRERFAVLTLAALILGGGLFPQLGVTSRYEAAMTVLRQRAQRIHNQSGSESAPLAGSTQGPTVPDAERQMVPDATSTVPFIGGPWMDPEVGRRLGEEGTAPDCSL
jgi:NADH-quinone oxidoreductase subunit M